MSTPPGKPRFCASCGAPLSPDARFCAGCGFQVDAGETSSAPGGQQAFSGAASAPASASPSAVFSESSRPGDAPPYPGTAQPGSAFFSATPPPQPEASPSDTCKIFLVSPGLYRGRVLLALRQILGLSPADASAYVAAAPVLLAVGLAPDVAERLRAALVGAGAAVRVESPPPPPPRTVERPPKPEPRKSISVRSAMVREVPARRGVRTVTGLCIGRSRSYLAYSRMDGDRLVAPPDFVRFEGRTMVPSAVGLAGNGMPEAYGFEALALWPRVPEAVQLEFTGEFGRDDGRSVEALRSFLKFLSHRLVQVLGLGALNRAEAASTNLAVPADWAEEQIRQFVELVEQSGFPLVQVVPEPLAAVAYHRRQGAAESPVGLTHTIVVDWGSQGLEISFVESGPGGVDAVVFDRQEFPLGGIWFDMLLEEWLFQKLQTELTDEDHRALALFARSFKEEASRTFSTGRAEHVQYCVVPAGTPPTRIVFSRAEADELFRDAHDQLRDALAGALDRIGFKPEHLDRVLVVGGGAHWYFVREIVRSTLNGAPIIAQNPDEVIALGLAAYGPAARESGK